VVLEYLTQLSKNNTFKILTAAEDKTDT